MTLLEKIEAVKKTGFCPGKIYQLLDPETIGGFHTLGDFHRLSDKPWHDIDYIDNTFVIYNPGDYFMICSIEKSPRTENRYEILCLYKHKLRTFRITNHAMNRFRQYFKEVN